ncbi:hypothetical protein QYE76_065408 [Lolium multiflorum]|uniref:C2H2-type domain-containing protein n=1 Tax=Lolium multiflorum TaxID=4521 RepID=A0AAD8S9M3_LOLMU|nr:hypothetical protein QYE76_065408 [Lolium multiflorum]
MEQIAKYKGIPSWDAAAAYDFSSPSSSSWEEQAFARDAAANLLVWPPRSYSCTFCRREFRSAQALGGHMNIHRRDRARLRHQDNEVQEKSNEEDLFMYKQPAPVSNPSTTTPSYRSTTIKEEERKRRKVLISMAARGQGAIHHHDQDLDDETGRSKRRRVDQQAALPIFMRSMATALVVAPHEGFALHHSKVLTETIASPTSSSPDPPLVDQREVDQFIKKQQLVDLELRLGPTQKLHAMQPN